jgi:hypothetical protein
MKTKVEGGSYGTKETKKDKDQAEGEKAQEAP